MALALAAALIPPGWAEAAGAGSAVDAAAAPPLACLSAADRDPAVERACAGVAAEACVEGLRAEAEAGALAACSADEAAGWERVVATLTDEIVALLRFQAAEAGATDQGAATPGLEETLLVEAQTAWALFREADCAQEAAHWGEDAMRDVAMADCRLDRAASRALELLGKRRMVENP